MAPLALALAAIALAAGCSVGNDERSAWVRQADAVCERHADAFRTVKPFTGDAVDEIQSHDVSPETFAEVARWSGDFLAVGTAVERDLEALGPPGDERSRRWLALNDESEASLRAVNRAAAAQDEQALYAAFDRQAATSERFIDVSQELGFRSCGTVIAD
jgi:hypothetical protein